MLKRELKINFKSFLIWTIILITIFLIVFLVYPSIINSENIKDMDKMMQMFPEEILKAFNMDISSIDSAFGWLKTEGFILLLLITNSYASIIGSNILLKEESDKTIEYLNSLPITRTKIIAAKIISGLFFVIIMTIIIGIFNYVGLTISGNFDKKTFILLSITPLFPNILIFSICLFLSTFTNKTKKITGISLGIVFISYALQTLSTLSENIKFLKYFSVFTLADTRNVIKNIRINPNIIILTIILTTTFLLLATIKYNKKELI